MGDHSDYVDTLPTLEKSRYFEKLTVIDGIDPYNFQRAAWSSNVELLPAITYPDMVNYLLFTPSPYTSDDLKAYKSLQAYNQFVSGRVRDVTALVLNGKHVVKARVMHSQSLREKPLSPWIIAEKSGKVLSAHYDCKAGLGEACTHVAALLFAVKSTTQIRDSKTVTDEKAYWKLPTAYKDIEYLPIAEIDFSSAKTMKQNLDASMSCDSSVGTLKSPKPPRVRKKTGTNSTSTPGKLESFFKEISLCGVKPAILSIIPPYSDAYIPKPLTASFPHLLTDLFDKSCTNMTFDVLLKHCQSIKVDITQEQADNVEKSTRGQADDKLWFKYRAGRITASRFRAVCHTDPGYPSLSLVKAICYPDSVKFSSAATAWGCSHEKIARNQYIQEMSKKHENFSVWDSGLIINPSYPYLGASPDGIVKCDCCGTGCLEIKCPYCKRHDSLSNGPLPLCLERTNDGRLKLKKTHAYYYQVQCQVNLGSYDYSDFVVWTELDILSDSDFFNEKLPMVTEFFSVAVLPELVGKFYSRPPLPNPSVNGPPDVNTSDLTKPSNDQKEDRSEDFEVWCSCKQGLDAQLIGCDNADCQIQWFHLKCVGIKRKPRGKWYCPDCHKMPQFKRGKKAKSVK